MLYDACSGRHIDDYAFITYPAFFKVTIYVRLSTVLGTQMFRQLLRYQPPQRYRMNRLHQLTDNYCRYPTLSIVSFVYPSNPVSNPPL